MAPANLLATKLEAFARRGGNDYLASPDFEDIVALLDGRRDIVEDVITASGELRRYIGAQLSKHGSDPRGRDAVGAHLEFGRAGAARAVAVVLPRLSRITADARGGA